MAINKRIRKDGSVGWQVVVDEHDPVTGRRTRHTIGTYHDHRTAKRQHAKAIADIAEGKFVQRSTDTVADLMALWIAAHGSSVRQSSRDLYQRMIDREIVPMLGTVPVQKLKPRMVQEAVNDWVGERKRYSTARKALAVLSAACKHGVSLQMIPSNPCSHVSPPKNPSKQERTVWSEPMTQAFLSTAEDHPLSLLWFLLIETGVRRGEALGLHWSAIDWSAPSISITHTAVVSTATGTSEMILQPVTKTDSSNRTILISSSLCDRLKVWRKDHIDTGLVFERDGKPLPADHLRYALRSLCKQAGVPVVSVHTLRHLAATRMMRAGVPLVVAQQRMGHSSSDMLRKVYMHADAGAQRDAVTALERLTAALPLALSGATASGGDAGTG